MISRSDLVDFVRRKVGDTGPRRMWSDEFLNAAVESAVIDTVVGLPQSFTQILDLAVNANTQTIDLPTNGVVFTRAYGEVVGNQVGRTLKWISETEITANDPCWRANSGPPEHLIYTRDQDRIWLDGQTINTIRCSVATIPTPMVEGNVINVRAKHRNSILYHVLSSMYSLPSNGAQKRQEYMNMFLQSMSIGQAAIQLSPDTLARTE